MTKPFRFMGVLTVLAALATGAGMLASSWPSSTRADEQTGSSPAVREARELSSAFRKAAEGTMPSVVTIVTKTKTRSVAGPRGQMAPEGENPFKGTPFEDFFGEAGKGGMEKMIPRQMPSREGMGSGVIIDASGIVLTNNHVVADADEVTVKLADGREFVGTDIKTDETTDLAVLRIKDAGKLPAAKLGDSDALQIGDWVIAIGNPFSYEQTVSAGIISGKGRSLPSVRRTQFLQTDAAINPGNSGGPLVNLDGEVIGINTAIASNTGSFQGIGFAVPANLAKWVTHQLVEKGSVERAWLGVGIRDLNSQLANEFHVQPGHGALVMHVEKNGPAAAAGFEPGDVVKSFGGHEVTSSGDLMASVERSTVGTKQSVQVLRDGKLVDLSVKLQAMPSDLYNASYQAQPEQEEAKPAGDHYSSKKFGFTAEPLSAEIAEQRKLDADAGVLISSVESDSKAAEAGLADGMVVVRVGNKAIHNVAEFQKALEDAADQASIRLWVRTRFATDLVILPNK